MLMDLTKIEEMTEAEIDSRIDEIDSRIEELNDIIINYDGEFDAPELDPLHDEIITLEARRNQLERVIDSVL